MVNSLYEGSGGQFARPIHGLAVIVGAPRGRVDIDVLGIEGQGPGLNSICHVPVKHANTCTTYKLQLQNNSGKSIKFRLLFEKRPALYFCNFIFITAHKLYNFGFRIRDTV